MKKIKLTRNKWAIVDDEDYEYLNQWKWLCSSVGYAMRHCFDKEKYKELGLTSKKHWQAVECIYMHRFINKTSKGFETDHINKNKLDNRKCNLRTVTHSKNLMNTGLWENNTSGYKGISWYKRYKKWEAKICVNYKQIYLGRFKGLSDAIKARKKAELIYHKI